MADPFTAMLVVAATATAAKGVAEVGAANARLESLDLARSQHVLQHQQKTLANYETSQKLLDAQTANATTRGVGLGSPSLEAIARNTENISAKNASNENIENDIYLRNINKEKENVTNTLFAELFGDAASASSDFISARSKMPVAAGK